VNREFTFPAVKNRFTALRISAVEISDDPQGHDRYVTGGVEDYDGVEKYFFATRETLKRDLPDGLLGISWTNSISKAIPDPRNFPPLREVPSTSLRCTVRSGSDGFPVDVSRLNRLDLPDPRMLVII
jgi:hypothetical protein